jgi:predicted dehydrogenase
MEVKKRLNRRDFLKTAALATAATAVPFIRTGEAAGDTIKVGVIGCGGRGTGAAHNALDADSAVKIIALADSFEDRAKDAQRSLNRRGQNIPDDMVFLGLDAYRKVLATDADYVILATPPGWRPEHFEAAVNAKKHIFTEKPVATDVVGIRRFMDAGKKSEAMKLSVCAGTQRRHQKPYIETIKKIRDGALGEVRACRAYWCGGPVIHNRRREPGWSDMVFQLRNWYSFCWICGDNIVEQHVHNLDVINWVMGTHPAEVFASGGRAWKPRDNPLLGNIWDTFSCDYVYPNGVHMLSMSRHWNRSDGDVSEHVVGTEKESNCADMGEPGRGLDPYVQEHKDLVASIRGDGRYYNEAIQVAESVMTAIMGRESAYTGKKLRWDEFMQVGLELVPKNPTLDMELPVREIPEPPKARW